MGTRGSALERAGGGARRDRTADLLLAKQALSQLSYGPSRAPSRRGRDAKAAWPTRKRTLVGLGRFELPTSPLSGVRSNHLSYRPEVGVRECRRQTPSLEIPARGPSNLCGSSRRACDAFLLKGGDPAARSRTATLLRLHPSHWPHRGKRPPEG